MYVIGPNRSRKLTHPTRGLHIAPTSDEKTRLEAWQKLLPRSVFTHLTAAWLYGWQLPEVAERPLFVQTRKGRSVPRRPGLRVIRTDSSTAVRLRGTHAVAEPLDVLLALAQDLELLDLLIVLDSALRLRRLRPEDLTRDCHGRRGARRLRQALALADPRAESAYESVLRLAHHTFEAEVQPQREIHDDAGAFVARADLWLVGTRRIHEYDGGDHLTRGQQQHDLARMRNLQRNGWTRLGYVRADLVRTPIQLLRDIDSALDRKHDPRLLTRWLEILSASSLTPQGRQRLAVRLKSGG